MKISVFGMGYVGTVTAACLASRDHEVIGVDVNPAKIEMISAGWSPVVEERIGELISDAVAVGALRAVADVDEAITTSEVSLVCVGTPSAPNGSLNTTFLERVAEDIGRALGRQGHRHTVAFRSTMLPGTCEELLIPILEQWSGLRAGLDFGVAVNPEFLREGSSVKDFLDPPKTVIGATDAVSADGVAGLYAGLPGEVLRVPIRVAEMAKYADNAFHALKIGFANEVGALCQALHIDAHALMDIFVADRKLNVSAAYLRPGFAFGGSCLPKDLRALVHSARRSDVSIPILEHVLPSNEEHLRRTYELVAATGKRRVGMFGLAFKPGTDDLRESPLVELAERLLGKGYELRIYDRDVSVSRLLGANREYIERRLPHLQELLVDSPLDVLAHAEVCLVGSREPVVLDALKDVRDLPIIDLVRLPDAVNRLTDTDYVGAAW